MSTNDNDEFSDLPDDFEGIDLDAIQALAPTSEAAGIHIGCGDMPESRVKRAHDSLSSSPYSCDDNFDESFLAALDALENENQAQEDHASTGVLSIFHCRQCLVSDCQKAHIWPLQDNIPAFSLV
jgi:hypothetical protein